MVQRRGVFEHMQGREVARRPEPGRFQPVDPDLLAGGERIRAHQLPVAGIEPGPRHQARRGSGADLFGELGEATMILGGEKTFLDTQFAKCDLEDLEVGDFIHHGRSGALVFVFVFVSGHAVVLSETRSPWLARRFEPAFRDLGLQRVVARPGVAVP